MTDPRNIAHDKKVQQEKHHHVEISPGAEHAVQPGKKPHMAPKPDAVVSDADTEAEPADNPATP